ncbi:MAG: GFA family protein [Pseudomonadota bacterium]
MGNDGAGVHSGRCACGKIHVAASGKPKLVANCHCKSCRKATGAAFATFVDFERAAVRIKGDVSIFKSSPGVERLFCGNCGSPVAYSEINADEINIHIGVFDEPRAFQPTEDSNLESRLWR